MRTAARVTAWTTAGVLGLGIAAGAAMAATTPPPAPKAQQHAKAGNPAHPGKAKRALAQRAVHGDFTVKTKDGYQAVALQRGTVSAVSATSISLRSPDSFSATYVVTTSTVVREKGKPVAITDIKVGDRAVVLAKHTGTTLTATRIMCLRPPKPSSSTPSGTSTS